MGFLDKLKEGADQAKGLAGQAVDRAKEEAKELNVKRQIAAAEGELGRAAFELVDKGAVSHPSLAAPMERLRALRAELVAIQAGQASGTDEAAGEGETSGIAGEGEASEPAASSPTPSDGAETGSGPPPSGGSPSS